MQITRFLLLAALGVFGGAITVKYFEFKRHQLNAEYSTELSVISHDQVDWRAGVDDNVVVEFKSFITIDGKRMLDGPSLSWRPALGDKKVEIYKHGSLISVKSSTRNY